MKSQDPTRSETGLDVAEIAELSYEEEVRGLAQPHVHDAVDTIVKVMKGRKTAPSVKLKAANNLIEHGHERPQNQKAALLSLGRGEITVIIAAPTEIGAGRPQERVIDTEAVETPDVAPEEPEGDVLDVAVRPPTK